MDERLRALDRLASHDAEASWARLRALARTRGRRELFLEVARLAREGDVAAREALARWSPLGALPVDRPEPGREAAAWRATHVTLEAKTLDPMTVHAASDELLVGHRGMGQGWGRVAALDPAAPQEPRWVRETGGMIAWRGDDLLHATPRSGAGAQVLAVDAPTGEVVSQAAVAERVWSLAVVGDRGLRKTGDPREGRMRVTVFDVQPDAFGRALWTRDTPVSAEAYLTGDACLVLEDAALRGHDLETGQVLWERPAIDVGLDLAGAMVLADASSVVLHGERPGRHLWATLALDARTGATRWSLAAGEPPVVGPTRVVLGLRGGRLEAVDRATGARAWELPMRDVTAARAGDRVLVVARRAGEEHLVSAVDVERGQVLLEATLERHGTPAISVLASATSACAAASTPGRLALARLACAP